MRKIEIYSRAVTGWMLRSDQGNVFCITDIAEN
jgi:hypothetical protein